MDKTVHMMVGFLFPALFLFFSGAWKFALLWWGCVIIWEAWKVAW